ncbi:hypothetical protein Agub_g510, partial [Astrephomene gubernaculifera]
RRAARAPRGPPAGVPTSGGRSYTQANSSELVPLELPGFEEVLAPPAGGLGCAVKHIRVEDTRVTLEYITSRPDETNRLIMAYGTEPFATVHFDVRFGSAKEAREYVQEVLDAGVRIGGRTFQFLGHSNEQLKTRTCVLVRSESQEEVRGGRRETDGNGTASPGGCDRIAAGTIQRGSSSYSGQLHVCPIHSARPLIMPPTVPPSQLSCTGLAWGSCAMPPGTPMRSA